jgi:hypothetical protein
MRRPILAALLLLAACSEPKKAVTVLEVMPNIPLPPGGEMISREGGTDALKLKFRSQSTPEEVADYYRKVLSNAPWTLVSENKTVDGTLALYAESSSGPPLWVTIRKAEGAGGTFVDLAGAKTK